MVVVVDGVFLFLVVVVVADAWVKADIIEGDAAAGGGRFVLVFVVLFEEAAASKVVAIIISLSCSLI